MYSVSMYSKVRRAVRNDGMSQREASRLFGIDPRSVRKMLDHAAPPGYQRQKPVHRPKLGPFTGVIDQILKEDLEKLKKHRHTAKRIFERLRDEHGFTGRYGSVKEYVRDKRLHLKEKFIPLAHAPGHAQVDFGEAKCVVIDGVEMDVHYFVMILPHSDACFVAGFPAERTEAFVEGHNAAFAFFGGVPQSVLYDNTSIAVTKVHRDGGRDLTKGFEQLQSHYLFNHRFGRPGRGNDKGKVENLVGFARKNFLVAAPSFADFDELNLYLEEKCRLRWQDQLRRHNETIGERFQRDRDVLLPLPPTPHDACEKVSTKATSQALVRYRSNDYSVPVRFGYHPVDVRGYIHEVVIACGAEVIARHPRSYAKEDMIFDPLHYLELLEEKPGALDQAAPLAGWSLPDEFATFRRLLEARRGKAGKREYIGVLRLMEKFSLQDVHTAIREAMKLGAIGVEAVLHLIHCQIEKRPPKLDLSHHPYLPKAQVDRTSAKDYNSLLAGAPS